MKERGKSTVKGKRRDRWGGEREPREEGEGGARQRTEGGKEHGSCAELALQEIHGTSSVDEQPTSRAEGQFHLHASRLCCVW